MPELTFDVTFPFPAAKLELALGLQDVSVRLREYAVVIEAYTGSGERLPDGMLNWGYSAPLKGCYQYVPEASPGGIASIGLPVLADREIGALGVRVLPWKLEGSSPNPRDSFERLVVGFSAADAPEASRFTTVGRSTP